MLKPYFDNKLVEAGCDEAGRGCLAGPVYAAAVILDPSKHIDGLNDSKLLSVKKRNALREEIEKNALAWAVASCSEQEIDEINILNASYQAMHRAIAKLKTVPNFLLIDGNRFKIYKDIKHECIVKGDSKFASIAAASILAKTHRDAYMQELAEKYPNYGFAKHKGYATKMHREAIKEYGYIAAHRKSFKLKEMQLELF